MLVTLSWISKNYSKFNNLYFDGKLPNVKFKISRSRNTWGYAGFRYDFIRNTVIPEILVISNYYDSPEEVKIQTLLHEMIHIADYTFHPEHFVRNGRRVSGHYYDAHGYWFMKEAKRIEKLSGYSIAARVTKGEHEVSTLSERSQRCVNNKLNETRIVVVGNIKEDNYWRIKTSACYLDDVKKLIKRYMSTYDDVKIYTVNNERVASMRSCHTRLRGYNGKRTAMLNWLETNGATQIAHYKN